MGTANTMHLACEALGMALPGTTPVRANSEPMWRAVEQAARRVVEMTAEDLRPRDILTPGAFANAVTSAGTLDETAVMQKLQHLNINTLGIVWARNPANYENISQVLAAMATIGPDGGVALYDATKTK